MELFNSLNEFQQRNIWKYYDDYIRLCKKYNYSYLSFVDYVDHISTSPKIFYEFANNWR